MLQYQDHPTERATSQVTHSVDGSTYSGQGRLKSKKKKQNHKHRDHKRHKSSKRDDCYYQRSENGTEDSYQRSESGTEDSSIRTREWVHGGPVPPMDERFPRGPVSNGGDSCSDSGVSDVSARTVIPSGRQHHANFSHGAIKHSRGAPSERSSIIHPRRDPSVATARPGPAINPPPSYREVYDGRSEAGSAYGMPPRPGISAPRPYGSEYERFEYNCNRSVADTNSDWVTVTDSDTGSDWVTESDCMDPAALWDGSYWTAYGDGYDKGVQDGLEKAKKPREDSAVYIEQLRTKRYG